MGMPGADGRAEVLQCSHRFRRWPAHGDKTMTICPIAIAVGCRRCPVVSICPVKSTLGDYKKDEPAAPAPKPPEAKAPQRKGE